MSSHRLHKDRSLCLDTEYAIESFSTGKKPYIFTRETQEFSDLYPNRPEHSLIRGQTIK